MILGSDKYLREVKSHEDEFTPFNFDSKKQCLSLLVKARTHAYIYIRCTYRAWSHMLNTPQCFQCKSSD